MNQVTFLIPLRIDTEDRLWNLDVVLRYLTTRLMAAEVIVIEMDGESRIRQVLERYPAVRHVFILNAGRFAKAEASNLGAMLSTRRYVCIYDTDVLLHPDAIMEAIDEMERVGWKIALPFNRVFIDVKGGLKKTIAETFDIDLLGRMTRLLKLGEHPEMSSRFLGGGIIMAHRETFLAFGGVNRKMISYGWEDTEVFKRFSQLGFPPLRLTSYSLIHLDHARGVDSRPGDHYDLNRQEYKKICAMSSTDLEAYVVTELSLTHRGDAEKIRALCREQAKLKLGKWLALRSMQRLLRASINAYGFFGLIKSRMVHS